MPITAEHIHAVVDDYLTRRPDQEAHLAPLRALLAAGIDVTDPAQWAGHVTASAVVTRPDRTLLLVHHVKYDKLLQPGGHAALVDSSLRGTSLRELDEETGLSAVQPVGEGPIHISVHPVPARPDRGEQAHQHFDFRFHFTTSTDVGELQLEEVHSAVWATTDDLIDASLRQTVALILGAAQ